MRVITQSRSIILLTCLVVAIAAGIPQSGQSQSERPSTRPEVEILRSARTVYVSGRDSIPPEPLEKKLFENKDFQASGLVLVAEPRADLVIELSRKQFTFDFTYRLVHPATGTLLGSGKVIAIDGIRAAPGLAGQIGKRLKAWQKLAETEQRSPKKR